MHTGDGGAAERHRVVPYEHAWQCNRNNGICTGNDGAIYPLRRFATPLPRGEARARWTIGNSSLNRNMK